ncbi:MAG TPA: hypothetical protein VFA01_02030 [Candidatus Dormibacteraeota bacterium]|nr:hypothetical protein [Candidatus Dormibacteraeota bacterium]
MGESDSARTERELRALRGQIDTDISLLRERVRDDLDVRELARRRPIPVIGGAVAASALAIGLVARRVAEARRRRPMADIDEVIHRLGGRVDRLKKKQRERLRESIRKEIGEVEMGSKIERTLWEGVTAALAGLATALAQSSIRRFFAEPPRAGRAPAPPQAEEPARQRSR